MIRMKAEQNCSWNKAMASMTMCQIQNHAIIDDGWDEAMGNMFLKNGEEKSSM